MTTHYHGTPITPNAGFLTLAGRFFCVSHAAPAQVAMAHRVGQGVMLDNGAFSVWKRGHEANWPAYYEWADEWLDYPTTWAVIPDRIGGEDAEQEALIAQWPHGEKGAPVWHLHSPIDRLLALLDAWPRVCMGSSAQYSEILSPAWERRMDDAWRAIGARHRRTPNVHMLRGMQLTRHRWPFASVDSTDVARNHNRPQNTPLDMVVRWDAAQCPPRFICRGEQLEMVA